MTARFLIASALALGLAVPCARAEDTSTVVHFEPGQGGTQIEGAVSGHDSADYVLGARAGQMMDVSLTATGTDGNGIIYFNILPPESDGTAIYNGSIDGTDTEMKLPKDGDYTIRVYLMGNDRDTGKTVDYRLDVSIR